MQLPAVVTHKWYLKRLTANLRLKLARVANVDEVVNSVIKCLLT